MSRRRRRSRRGSSGRWNYFWDFCRFNYFSRTDSGGVTFLYQEKTLTLNKDFCPSQGLPILLLYYRYDRAIAEATQISARK